LLLNLVLPSAALADAVLVESPERSGYLQDKVRLKIFGEIRPEDAKHLPALIKRAQEKSDRGPASEMGMLWVSLDSTGGNVFAAMEIGRLLRAASAHILVDQNAECSSACIFVLAGGADRRWVLRGARLGLHRPVFEQALFARLSPQEAQKLYNSMSERCRQYLDKMGMADDLFRKMLRIPSQRVEYIDQKYAESVGLIGEDPAFAEWSRAKDIERLGKEKVRQRDNLLDCLNAGVGEDACFKRFGPWPK